MRPDSPAGTAPAAPLPPWAATYERAVLGAAALPAGAPRLMSAAGAEAGETLAVDLGRALALSDLARRALTHLAAAPLDLHPPAPPSPLALRRFDALALAVKGGDEVGGEGGAAAAVAVCLLAARRAGREAPPRLLAGALERLLGASSGASSVASSGASSGASGEPPLPPWLALWLAGERGRWLAAADARWAPLLASASPPAGLPPSPSASPSPADDARGGAARWGEEAGARAPAPSSAASEVVWRALARPLSVEEESATVALVAPLALALSALADARREELRRRAAEVCALWLVCSAPVWSAALLTAEGRRARAAHKDLFQALGHLHESAWHLRARREVSEG